MEDKCTTEDQALLVAEFQQISVEYDRRRKEFDEASSELLRRRRDIVLSLVSTGLTHREVGFLVGLSTGRIGQLVKGATGYVPQRQPARPEPR